MARTKGTARYCRPLRIAHHRGWYRTAKIRHFHSTAAWHPQYDNAANIVLVPTSFALARTHLGPSRLKGSPGSPATERASSTEPGHRSSRLLELPTEILLQIFRLLLPEGEVFHFSPTGKKNIRAVSIHRISPSGSPIPHAEEDLLRSLPDVSIICSRLTEIAYAIFFGSNQFVFEVASVKLVSNVSCTEQTRDSWHRTSTAKPDGLAPLTSIAARYLTSLTLCISLTSRKPQDYEWKRLEKFVQQIADALGTKNDLKALSVHLGVATSVGRRRDSKALEVTSVGGLHMRIRKDDALPSAPPETLRKLKNVIEPLLDLEGPRERQISGLLTDESLSTIQQSASDGQPKMQADDVDELRSSRRTNRH